MAFLRLNENNMVLDIVVGVNEEYKPTDKNKELSDKVESLRAKMADWKKKEEEFLLNQVNPVLVELRNEITSINETTYPELKAKREAREAETKR